MMQNQLNNFSCEKKLIDRDAKVFNIYKYLKGII